MAMFNSYVKLPEGILIEATDGIIPSDIHAAISKCCELVWQGISVKDAVPVHQEKSEQSYKNGFIHTRELS